MYIISILLIILVVIVKKRLKQKLLITDLRISKMKLMLYYFLTLKRILNKKGVSMEFVYIGIGMVIVIVVILFLDIDCLSNLFAKKEEKLDEKAEHDEEGK